MKRVKVKDNFALERDRSSNAVINTSETAYKQRLKQKEMQRKNREEINQIKSDLAEIKALRKQLENISRHINLVKSRDRTRTRVLH